MATERYLYWISTLYFIELRHHITAGNRHVKDFPKLPLATFYPLIVMQGFALAGDGTQ